jgi:hypothetical protein
MNLNIDYECVEVMTEIKSIIKNLILHIPRNLI